MINTNEPFKSYLYQTIHGYLRYVCIMFFCHCLFTWTMLTVGFYLNIHYGLVVEPLNSAIVTTVELFINKELSYLWVIETFFFDIMKFHVI